MQQNISRENVRISLTAHDDEQIERAILFNEELDLQDIESMIVKQIIYKDLEFQIDNLVIEWQDDAAEENEQNNIDDLINRAQNQILQKSNEEINAIQREINIINEQLENLIKEKQVKIQQNQNLEDQNNFGVQKINEIQIEVDALQKSIQQKLDDLISKLTDSYLRLKAKHINLQRYTDLMKQNILKEKQDELNELTEKSSAHKQQLYKAATEIKETLSAQNLKSLVQRYSQSNEVNSQNLDNTTLILSNEIKQKKQTLIALKKQLTVEQQQFEKLLDELQAIQASNKVLQKNLEQNRGFLCHQMESVLLLKEKYQEISEENSKISEEIEALKSKELKTNEKAEKIFKSRFQGAEKAAKNQRFWLINQVLLTLLIIVTTFYIYDKMR